MLMKSNRASRIDSYIIKSLAVLSVELRALKTWLAGHVAQTIRIPAFGTVTTSIQETIGSGTLPGGEFQFSPNSLRRWGTIRACSILSFLVVLSLQSVAAPAQTAAPQAVSPRQFGIMPWGISPSDKAQLQLIKDAGFNVSGFCLVKDLDLVASMGLSCFVTDNRSHVYDWKKLPADEVIRSNVSHLKGDVEKYPAAMGFLLQDEPSVSMLPGLGRVAAFLREAMPDRWALVDLLPTYASPQQLGAATYWDYMQAVIANIHPQFLITDHYAVEDGKVKDSLYTNLEIFRHYSSRESIPFWTVILTAKILSFMEPSDATLNVQVYSVLAYGGRGIADFRYTPGIGDTTRMTAIDKSGNRTPTWELLQRINAQINALAPTLIRLRSAGVYHFADIPKEGHPLTESHLVSSVSMTSADRQPITPRFLVGEFQDGTGRPYLMIVNKDLNHAFNFQIHLKAPLQKLLWISNVTGQEQSYKSETDRLAPGAGMLFRVE